MKNDKIKSSRRKFLKLGLFTGSTLLMGKVIGSGISESTSRKNVQKQKVLTIDGELIEIDKDSIHPHKSQKTINLKAREGIAGRKLVMVIDLSKCDGCEECTKACQKMHYVPPDREWIKIYKMQDTVETAPYWLPRPCFQCDVPPCTKVCPVDATFKRKDGIVLIDNDRCIGCRFCMAACPYSARFFNWGRPDQPPEAVSTTYSPEQSYPARIGTVEKCDFCPDLAIKGILPACVKNCPMDAIYYGDENEDAVTNNSGETISFRQIIDDNAGYVYMEDLGTKPRVYYLPPKNRRYPGPQIAHLENGNKG